MSRTSKLRADKMLLLQDKYQRKADRYWADYQIDGQAFQLRTYERNLFMAEVIADALEGNRYKLALCEVEHRVSELPTDDPEACVKAVRELQCQVSERGVPRMTDGKETYGSVMWCPMCHGEDPTCIGNLRAAGQEERVGLVRREQRLHAA